MPLEQEVTFADSKLGWKKLRSSNCLSKEDIITHVSVSTLFFYRTELLWGLNNSRRTRIEVMNYYKSENVMTSITYLLL